MTRDPIDPIYMFCSAMAMVCTFLRRGNLFWAGTEWASASYWVTQMPSRDDRVRATELTSALRDLIPSIYYVGPQ